MEKNSERTNKKNQNTGQIYNKSTKMQNKESSQNLKCIFFKNNIFEASRIELLYI